MAVAINGVEAVAAVRDTGFDLIWMDVCMPIVDGLTATRTIRALKGPQSKVPNLVISDDVQSIMNAGMND